MQYYKDFASSHIRRGSQSSKNVGVTSSDHQVQSLIKKRARSIPPSILKSSTHLVETSHSQRSARIHPRKDNKIQHTQMQSSKDVGVTSSDQQGQSPIKKRSRSIPPSIVKSSTHLVVTSHSQQSARIHPRKDNKIQRTQMQKCHSPRLNTAMANEEDGKNEENESNDVGGGQNKPQVKSSTHLAETSYMKEGARTHPPNDNNIQLMQTHFEEREQIIFNANWQPIGPSDRTLCNFSHFLGTIARTHVYCPLTYNSWKELHKARREEIWDYVNSKYIIPAQAERYVMKTLNDAWRLHKCRVKRAHFTRYRTDAERLKNCPSSIPETDFKKLIKYWKTDKAKKLSEMNTKTRAMQKWHHRAGPTSFARIQERLRASKENHDSPSQAEMFATTRRGNHGKQLDKETSDKIERLEALTSSGYDATTAFQSLFGVEKYGQARYYGRNVTPSTLKKNEEMEAVRKESSDQVEKLQETIRNMQRKMKGLIAFIEHVLQRNPNLNMDPTALSYLLATSSNVNTEDAGSDGDEEEEEEEEEEGDDESYDDDEI